MGFSISWSIQGEQQLSRRLRVAADQVKDWTPAFQETAVTLQQIFSGEVFDTEGGAIDEEWEPLSPAYQKQKQRKYGNGGILQATGAMRNSFTSVVTPMQTTIGNSAPYFKYHQSNAPRTKIPRRVMMKLAETQRLLVVTIFHDYFYKAINS